MLRIATVGTSAITEKFISAAKKTGRFTLETAYSRSPQSGRLFAEKHGFNGFSADIEALAREEKIDAVYIASPNSLHFAQSKLFLENGKHVLCEKPIVTDKKQLDELDKLAEKNGLVYTEAIMSRHCKGRKKLLEAIGEIGRISVARFDFCQRSSRYDAFMSGEHMNIFDMSLGAGTLNDLGIYCVYAAVDLLGMPKNITASASFFDKGADKSGAAIFSYDDFTAVLSYSKAGQSAAGSEIIGDRGTLRIGSVSQYASASLIAGGSEQKLTGIPTRDEIMGDEAAKFADYIENPENFKTDYREVKILAQRVHTCMELIRQSAGLKYPIKEIML